MLIICKKFSFLLCFELISNSQILLSFSFACFDNNFFFFVCLIAFLGKERKLKRILFAFEETFSFNFNFFFFSLRLLCDLQDNEEKNSLKTFNFCLLYFSGVIWRKKKKCLNFLINYSSSSFVSWWFLSKRKAFTAEKRSMNLYLWPIINENWVKFSIFFLWFKHIFVIFYANGILVFNIFLLLFISWWFQLFKRFNHNFLWKFMLKLWVLWQNDVALRRRN